MIHGTMEFILKKERSPPLGNSDLKEDENLIVFTNLVEQYKSKNK